MRLDSITDIGVKRKENQDNYWGAILDVDGDKAGVVCLCDGMGGLNNGGLASKIVVEAVRNHMLDSFDISGLDKVLKTANTAVYSIGSGKDGVMGTTCTIVICYRGSYYVYHVGDTRCYLLRNHKFNPITVDHSALKKYNITKEKNLDLWKKYKNSLTRCIGVKNIVQIDYIKGTYQDGDVFFLCSDGLWHYLEDYTFEENELYDLKYLISKCIETGETDNITAGILEI